MKYIDIHTHPFKEYHVNPLEVVHNWKEQNMDKMFIVGTSKEDSIELLELCSHEKYLYPIIGIHPTLANGKSDGDFLESIITKDVIGIGEIGLDYHYDDSPSKEIQKESFLAQLRVAKKHNIVGMLHLRDSLDDAFDIFTLDEFKNINIILHSFSGDSNYVKKCLPYSNIYFSISGIVTFKNAQKTKDAVKEIPLDRIFCETDSPYLAPVPMRGKENISPYVMYTYREIANLKNVSEEFLVNQISKNVKKVFNI
ncbi:TatD family hydrolase [Metamycoplasma buccale]|uniref:TatD family hydrolase n=1 Tax=Metamycoplasma buccale TaxID=55602 RepID=UPI00398ED1BE